MFVLTIISIILFVMCLWYFVTPFNPGFESVSDALFNRDPFESSSNITNKIINGHGNEVFNSDVKYEVGDFWVYLSRFMMCVMIAAIILLIVTRVLGHKGKVRDYKIDIPVYVLVILSFAVYYLTPILFAEYKVEMNRIHVRYFITAARTSAPIRMIPRSSRSLSASSPTPGTSRVISSGPSLVSRASASYSSICTDV